MKLHWCVCATAKHSLFVEQCTVLLHRTLACWFFFNFIYIFRWGPRLLVIRLGHQQVVTLIIVTVDCFVLIQWTIFQLHCNLLAFLGRFFSLYVFRFHLRQVKLLRTQNGSWPRNSNPPNERLGGYLVFLHCPQANECARPSKTCFAMNSDCSWIFLAEMLICHLEKLINDIIRRRWPINEKQIIMRNVIL